MSLFMLTGGMTMTRQEAAKLAGLEWNDLSPALRAVYDAVVVPEVRRIAADNTDWLRQQGRNAARTAMRTANPFAPAPEEPTIPTPPGWAVKLYEPFFTPFLDSFKRELTTPGLLVGGGLVVLLAVTHILTYAAGRMGRKQRSTTPH